MEKAQENMIKQEYVDQETTRIILTELRTYVDNNPQKLQYLKTVIMPLLEVDLFCKNIGDSIVTLEIQQPLGVKRGATTNNKYLATHYDLELSESKNNRKGGRHVLEPEDYCD